MKKYLPLLVILIGAYQAFGQVTFTGSPTTSTVNLGSTFNVTIGVTSSDAFEGFSLYVGTTPGDADLFTVTADMLTSQFQFIAGGPSLPANLSTSGTPDLGSTETPSGMNLAAGSYTLTTLIIQADNGLSPGEHTLTILGTTPDSAVYNSSFSSFGMIGSTTFNIDVVPEPGTASLLLGGLLGCALFSPYGRRLLRLS